MRFIKRCAMVLAAPILAAAPMCAQAASRATQADLRTTTFTVGVGNSAGWFGLRGEKYFSGDRLSISGGLGYTPATDGYAAAGVTVALAARGYTPGRYHRGFVELSYSQVQVEGQYSQDGTGYWHGRYGPGVQVGYQLVTRSGFTVDLSAGVGRALSGRPYESRVAALLGLGLGYTFR